VKAIIEAAGGNTEGIIKMTVYLRDRDNREPVNAEWVRMFPDPPRGLPGTLSRCLWRAHRWFSVTSWH
jgi:enamine deaminase RidA (YjgF/YER057c/UK114 family)